MTNDLDSFSIRLLEESKRFLERASEGDTEDAYLHASLVLCFSSLESHLNGIAQELALRSDTSLLERSVLEEKAYRLRKGSWELTSETVFYRLEDRLAFLFRRYGNADVSERAWWSELKVAMDVRNQLVHPREVVDLTPESMERHLKAVIDALDDLYQAVFQKGHPASGRGLQSRLVF